MLESLQILSLGTSAQNKPDKFVLSGDATQVVMVQAKPAVLSVQSRRSSMTEIPVTLPLHMHVSTLTSQYA